MNPTYQALTLVIAVILLPASLGGAQVASSGVLVPSSPVEPTVAALSVSTNAAADPATHRLRTALTLATSNAPNSSPPVLIVPAEQLTPEELADITQDVNVMRRIFENKLRQANLLPKASPFSMFVGSGYPYFGGGEDDMPQSMYLQGYGVLFTMNADYPLAPGPEAEPNETPEPQAEGDPVWARTREEIYQPQQVDRRKDADESRPNYNAEQVDNLTTTVIHTLVHAANIRNLTPEESVIVRLTGSPESEVFASETITIPGTGQVVVKGRNDELKIVEGPLADTARTVLTIRAKMADIKALAEGQLTEEQFRQRVQVLSHPLLSAAASASPTAPVMTTGTSQRRTGTSQRRTSGIR